MHELGILTEVIKTVEKFAAENQIQKIQELVLQVGEISSVIPEYMEKIYPIAVEGTSLEQTALRLEVLPANGECRDCQTVFHATVAGGVCPQCGSRNMKLVSGREFLVKEIVCEE